MKESASPELANQIQLRLDLRKPRHERALIPIRLRNRRDYPNGPSFDDYVHGRPLLCTHHLAVRFLLWKYMPNLEYKIAGHEFWTPKPSIQQMI
jgi:hypothetical protein